MDAQRKLILRQRGEMYLTLPGLSSFTEQVGSTFDVMDVMPTSFGLKLTRVIAHAKTDHNEAFSVFFLGPLDRFMSQGTRRLHHTQLGELELFLVPVAKTNDGFEYEAAFNYLLK
jgi:hypothetical protein